MCWGPVTCVKCVTHPYIHTFPHSLVQLWDNCFTRGPDFFYLFVTSYFLSLRSHLLSLETDQKLTTFLSGKF